MILSFTNFWGQNKPHSSPTQPPHSYPNLLIYKAILVGILQGLYFLPFPSAWAFISFFLFLLHCWFLVDLFFQSKNLKKLLFFSYLFLLPSCAIRYGWIFSSLWAYGDYSQPVLFFFYLLGVHWIVFIHLVCFGATFFILRRTTALFFKKKIATYSKITIYIISYFAARLLLDISYVPGGEWVENPFLGNLLAPSFLVLGSHILDSWVYFLTLVVLFSVQKKTLPKAFLLAIFFIVLVIAVTGFFYKNTSASQQQIKFALITKRFIHPKELENFIKKQKNSSINLWITAETAVDFYLETDNFLSKLHSILPKNQVWVIGAKKKELGENQFFYYNSAYFIEAKNFTNRHYKKELLVPFAEYIPSWANFLKINPLVNLGHLYQSAPKKNIGSVFQWKDKNIALGICFEEYFDNWYFSKKQPVAMYIFLNSETFFNKWGKHFLKNTAASKAKQWNAPSLRTTFSGYSGFWQSAKAGKASQEKNFLTGEIFLNSKSSIFLSFGKIIHSLNFLFFVCLLLLTKEK